MNQMNIEEQKQFAIEEMTLLGIAPSAIRQFTDAGVVLKSVAGQLKPLSALEAELVASFEKRSGCLAYHVIYSFMLSCHLLNILFASPSLDDCTEDLKIIDSGRTKKYWQLLAYCINLDIPEFSEFGSIEVLKIDDGLIRIG